MTADAIQVTAAAALFIVAAVWLVRIWVHEHLQPVSRGRGGR